MVITVTLYHVYRFPVELVYKCYSDKYCGSEFNSSERVEKVEFREDGGMDYVKRIIAFKNFFPSIFQRINLLKTKEVIMEEECWSDSFNRRFWIRSHNLTWQNDATIAHCAFLCPDEQVKNWTKWQQESYVDFGYMGKMGTILELYMKRHIENQMKTEIESMEKVMSLNKI